MALRVLVVQHIWSAGLGAYGDVLREREDEVLLVDCERGDDVPAELPPVDAIVSLGGPWSVHAADRPAWMEPELRLLRSAAERGVPVFGVCLGAQLLAAALGGRVYTGSVPEIGVHPIRLLPPAAADPVFGGLPAELPMFHWHGDSFDLPDGAIPLAGSAAYANQAFRFGATAYGVQFHAESAAANVRAMVELPATRAQLDEAHGPGAADRILEESVRALPGTNAVARRLLAAWLELVEARSEEVSAARSGAGA
jgi:GMP synthase-like glutamine amidotransferase